MSDSQFSTDPQHADSQATEASFAELPETAAELLDAVRASSPLVHSITNSVVTGFTANVLLALGAAPAMVDIVGESGMFAGIANGLLVNLGTPTPEQREAMREAVAGANAAGTPWVLDPVAIGALPVRTALAAEIVEARPTVVRGNASEIMALAERARAAAVLTPPTLPTRRGPRRCTWPSASAASWQCRAPKTSSPMAVWSCASRTGTRC